MYKLELQLNLKNFHQFLNESKDPDISNFMIPLPPEIAD